MARFTFDRSVPRMVAIGIISMSVIVAVSCKKEEPAVYDESHPNPRWYDPCPDYKGTSQVIANVCDNKNGSFYVVIEARLKTNKIAYLMDRLGTWEKQFPFFKIVSVSIVTSDSSIPNIEGAFVKYEQSRR